MCEKLAERKEREAKAWRGDRSSKASIPDSELFKQMGGSVKVVKKGKK